MDLTKWAILMGESHNSMGTAKEVMQRILTAYREEKNG